MHSVGVEPLFEYVLAKSGAISVWWKENLFLDDGAIRLYDLFYYEIVCGYI